MTTTSLITALLGHAAQRPDKPALKYEANGEQKAISFLELFKLVAFFRKQIIRTCISKNAKIVTCIDNSAEYIAVLYASWIEGLTVIPLHSQSKAREINHIIEFTEAQLFVCKKNNPILKQINSASLTLDIETAFSNIELDDQSYAVKISAEIDTSQTALILFTSGTTGNPKGVMLSHDNLIANTLSIVKYLQLTKDDEVYCVLPFTYSYGNSVLQTHIYAGACIQLGQSMLYPQRIAEDLLNKSITGFSGVPSTFQILLHKTSFSKTPPALRYITQAGGAMNTSTTTELLSLLPNTDIFVMYGQTEASARLSYLPPDMLLKKVGSIGIAIPGVTLTICNEQYEPLPNNQTGELIAKGDNIMQGYFNNPEETQTTLVNGWLHTGDLGYIDNDGFIYIQGRKTQMIKSGANRIHPEEIEEIISECINVSEVAVTGIEDSLLGQLIAAFIVLKKGHTAEEKIIRSHCRQNLPPHKQPKLIYWVNNLPRTSSGKVMRHLLVETLNQKEI